MPRDDIARAEYGRPAARYASDLSDREWELIEPLLPSERSLGRLRTTDLREALNAILYLASTGCQWRMLPRDFPPVSTVQGCFYEWREAAALDDDQSRAGDGGARGEPGRRNAASSPTMLSPRSNAAWPLPPSTTERSCAAISPAREQGAARPSTRSRSRRMLRRTQVAGS